jgi:DNA-binding NtrC family response regulator
MKHIKDLNIFVVDDNPICLRTYQQYLSRLGCQRLRLFESGQECVDEISEMPDLVLVDYSMEPMDGLDVLKRIKRTAPTTFLVMISGQNDLQVAVNAMKYGAFDYIIKGQQEGEQIAAVLHKMLHEMNLVKRGRPRTVWPQKMMANGASQTSAAVRL